MHPYRELPAPCDAPSVPREELILYAVLCLIGAIPLAIAALGGDGFGAEATLGLAMVLAGAVGLVSVTRRRR